MKDGSFNCESVKQNGFFLDMKLSFTQSSLPLEAHLDRLIEVSIPLHFVLYTITGDAQKSLGFTSCELAP
jgi:hypothetical protein